MSCYTDKMDHLLRAAGKNGNTKERRRLDRAIRGRLKMEIDTCYDVWEQVKSHLSDSAWTQSLIGDLERGA